MTQILRAALFLLIVHGLISAQAAPDAWVVSALKRVLPAELPGPQKQVTLWAGKGEYEPVQIVVRGPNSAAMSGVSVTVSDLTGPAGQVLSKANIQLFRESYIQVAVSSPDWGGRNRPNPPGYYPDALIPANDPITNLPLSGGSVVAFPFNVAVGQVQPIWADFYIPPATAAGVYTGSFTVSSSGGQTVIPIRLTVWNFQHPLKPSLQSSFAFQTATGTNKPAVEALFRHKLTPLVVPPAQEADFVNRYGLSITNLALSSGANISTCSMKTAPSAATIASAKTVHSGAISLYNYTADEVDACGTGIYTPIKQWAQALHSAGIPQLITIMPVAALFDDGTGTGRSAVDIWVLSPKMYDSATANVKSVQAKGDSVWSYNAFASDPYSPKWLLDYDLINFRVQPGFINQSLGLTGLLYYAVDKWGANPWSDQDRVNSSGYHFPGDGVLVYPGTPVNLNGVVPSMRLKQLREGVEDYEYIQMLKAKGSGAWALNVAAGVGPDWANWSHNAAYLEAARRVLGQELDRLSGAPVTSGPVRYAAAPVGAVPIGTTQVNVSLATSTASVCRYSTTPETPYSTMTGPFTTTGGTSHSFLLTSLEDMRPYIFYVRCSSASATNTDDFVIAFNTRANVIPRNPTPLNASLGVVKTPTLTWEPILQATSYSIYGGISPTSLSFILSTGATSWYPGTLQGATTYYWKVVATVGGVQYSSPVWSFKTQ